MKIIRDGKEIELTSEEIWQVYNEVRCQNYRNYIEDRMAGEWKFDRLSDEEKSKTLDELMERMLYHLTQYDCSDDTAYASVCEEFLEEPVTMKIRDIIKLEIDVDVEGNIAIAFCGPLELTPEGIEHFSDVLDLDIEVGDTYAYVDPENSRLYDKAKEFFWSAAGYCSDSLWAKYFKEED